MLLEDKLCLNCKKPLPKEMRKDAKYCNEWCKTEFNNLKRYGLVPEVTRVDKILHRNFEILQKLLKDQKSIEVSKAQLEKKGFKFDFFTQIRGTSYKYCYTLSFREKDANTILIGLAPDHVLEQQFES